MGQPKDHDFSKIHMPIQEVVRELDFHIGREANFLPDHTYR